jgi:hypothetical protein
MTPLQKQLYDEKCEALDSTRMALDALEDAYERLRRHENRERQACDLLARMVCHLSFQSGFTPTSIDVATGSSLQLVINGPKDPVNLRFLVFMLLAGAPDQGEISAITLDQTVEQEDNAAMLKLACRVLANLAADQDIFLFNATECDYEFFMAGGSALCQAPAVTPPDVFNALRKAVNE